MWCPQVFNHLVEHWILLLFLFPVSDIGSHQPCWPSPYCLFLANILSIWTWPDSLLSTLFDGHDSVVEYSFNPWIWDLVQVFLSKYGKARMGAWRSKASRASGNKSMCSNFLSLLSPLVRSYRGTAILAKPFMKYL